MTRNTIQKSIIYDALVDMKNHPSAEEVYAIINEQHPSISKATVYRVLSGLSEANKIKKIQCFNGADRFDHNISNHNHLMCRKCNRLYDIEVNLEDIMPQSFESEGNQVLGYTIIYDGYCRECVKSM